MPQFKVTASIIVNAESAEGARNRGQSVLDDGRTYDYFGDGAEIISVDAYAAPRTYTQAEVDALVLAARQG